MSRLDLIVIGSLAVIGVFALLYLLQVPHMENQGESLSLSFDTFTSLPRLLYPGRTYSFSFTARNPGSIERNVQYVVTATDLFRDKTLKTDALHISPGENITVPFQLAYNSGELTRDWIKVEVRILDNGESVYFWARNVNGRSICGIDASQTDLSVPYSSLSADTRQKLKVCGI